MPETIDSNVSNQMTYNFNDKIKDFSIKGVRVLGNPVAGVIIGIDSDSGNDLDQIIKGKATAEQINKQSMLLNELHENGYFSPIQYSLVSAYVHLTSACNLHCVGCYSYEDERNKRESLSTAQVFQILENLKQSGVQKLVFSGGEPFLRKDISEILRYAKGRLRFSSIIVVSNGTLPVEAYIKCAPYIDMLNISIDGYAKDVIYLRDSGIMPIIEKNIETLKGIVNLNMIVTLHRKNINDIPKYLDLSNRLQVPFTVSLFTVPADNPVFKDFILTDEDYTKLEEMYECFSDVVLTDSALEGDLGCKEACGAGKTMVSISANGTIYPCHMLQMDEFRIGNALTDSVSEAVLNGNLYNLTVSDISDCNVCEYRFLCGGGCRFRSYAHNNGDMSRKDKCCGTYKGTFSKMFTQLLNQ